MKVLRRVAFEEAYTFMLNAFPASFVFYWTIRLGVEVSRGTNGLSTGTCEIISVAQHWYYLLRRMRKLVVDRCMY